VRRRRRGETVLPNYVLKLYVAGTTPRSTRAIANLHSLCDRYLDGRHELEVVDIFQQPERAAINQIVAVPALLKTSPAPVRCLVGDLSDRKKLLRALNLDELERSVP
jgi:circadian clock protein KaiB